MAVTRSFLKGMGLTDEQVSAIIEEHSNTVKGLTEARDRYKADAEKLAEVQKQLDSLKGGEDYKQKYTDLKKMFDDYKAEVKNAETTNKVKAAYINLLKAANVDEKRIDAIVRITDLKDMKLDADGKLEDSDKLTESIKNEWSAFIPTNIVKGANVEQPIQKESNKMTRAEIYAKDEKGHYKLSTAERQKALVENSNLLRN